MSGRVRAACWYVAAGLAMTYGAIVLAQGPDLSGTWKLNAERSRIATDATFAGVIAAGAPERLHVTQAANGTLMIESEINEGHVRVYTPRAPSSTPIMKGGAITMHSRWDGRALVSEGRQESPSGTSTIVKQVKEVIALSMDGATLNIEITTTGEAGGVKAVSTLSYGRADDVGPCEKWTTPCKEPTD